MIEEVNKPAGCGAPTSLLREAGAPAVYVRSWDELPAVLESYSAVPSEVGRRRRVEVRRWYRDFLELQRARFLSTAMRAFAESFAG